MESQARLTSWILQNRDALKIKIYQSKALSDWVRGLQDFQCTLVYGGREFTGRASDFSADLALIKAVAEAIERTAAHSAGLSTTVGCAAHFQGHRAKYNGFCELVERHLFYSKLHERSNYRTISDTDFAKKIGSRWRESLNALYDQGVTVIPLEVNEFGSLRATAVLLSGNGVQSSFGVFLGLGCDRNLNESFRKAYLEALRKAAHFFASESPIRLTLEQFAKIENPSPIERQRLGADPKYGSEFIINNIFRDDLAPILNLKNKEFTVQFSELPVQFLNMPPLRIFKASSPQFQPYSFNQPLPFD